MTDEEIHTHIAYDFQLILSRYLNRLSKEYDKTRRRNKISKTADFHKCFEFRTPSKNKWILIFNKEIAAEVYKGEESISFTCLVYYSVGNRIRIFKVMPHETGAGMKGLAVYNAHFFSRYNERLNLNLNTTLEKVKHFFIHNGVSNGQVYPEGENFYLLSKFRDGIMLGEIQNKGRWAVFKTFIPNNFAFPAQLDEADRLIKDLQNQLEEDLKKPDFDRNSFMFKANVLKGMQ